MDDTNNIEYAEITPSNEPTKPKVLNVRDPDYLRSIRIDKPKGAISKKTKIINSMQLATIESFKDWLTNEGLDKFKSTMQDLDGKDYIVAYVAILEHFVPKLSRRVHDISDDLKVDQISFE